jgi:cyclomaltodextrinase
MKKIFYSLLMMACVSVQAQVTKDKIHLPAIDAEQLVFKHPSWTNNSVIYEVNLRQYNPEGTFKSFEKELPRLKSMGVDILWFMPIHPIGVKERKGSLGSYYSVQDYTAVNPEHGSMEDFKNLVKKIHESGMHVIIDWVANHTAADSKWSKEHPEYFTKNDKGEFVPPVADWSDVIDLNFDVAETRRAMIEAMKFWINEIGIDGFRCDVAEMVPLDFWMSASKELRALNQNVFMLAEGEKAELHAAFDMTYTWSFFHEINKIAKGEEKPEAIDRYLNRIAKEYVPNAYRMYFTSNHDENSWNGTEYERMGAGAQTFAVLCATLPGMPLVYSGQESGLNRRLKFFDKDVIDWKNYPLQDFYTKLMNLKRTHPALQASELNSNFQKISKPDDAKVYAFTRGGDNKKIIVILNLTAQASSFDPMTIPGGKYRELFNGNILQAEQLKGMELKAWDYKVFVAE